MSYLSTLQALPNVKAIWLCDEAASTGTMADSQGSHTATLVGAGTQGTTSLLTDGGKSITWVIGGGGATIPSSADWQVGTGDFWALWWFKTTQATAIWLGGETGDLYTGIVSSKLRTDGSGGSVIGATSVDDGATHLAVFTRVSGTMNIYLDNGALDATGTYSGSCSISTALGIGSAYDSAFNVVGIMDGAAWGKGSGLTQSDAQAVYAAGLASGPAFAALPTLLGSKAVRRASNY